MKTVLDNRDTLTHGSILSLYLFRNTIGKWRRCICWAKVGKGMGDKDEGTRSLFFYRIDNVAGKALQVPEIQGTHSVTLGKAF